MDKGSAGCNEAKLLIGGVWVEGRGRPFDLIDKYSGERIAAIASADKDQVDAAVAAAKSAFEGGRIEPYRRYEILMAASEILQRRRGEIVEVMVAETGFTAADNGGDFNRCVQTLRSSAEEAKRLTGEIVPMEGAPGHDGELAFTLRVPLGVVCAITPFNSPLNTVAHKVAPALAAGNAVVLKPASYTPLSSLKLCEVLIEAGLPEGWLNLVFGGGGEVGGALLAHPDVRYYAFTGGTEAGRVIQQGAGLRRTQLELGNISATILCADADLDAAIPKCVATSFRKAGQVCVSLQRLYVHDSIIGVVADRLATAASGMKAGDPRDPATQVGPMIAEAEAVRAEAWVREAVAQGAKALTPVRREGPVLWPVVLSEVTPEMRVLHEEIFAPVVCLVPFGKLDQAIEAVNATPYGLAAGIYTSDIDTAFEAARRVEVGLFNINGTSSNRADLMPYGGCKDSGFGREGPRYAVRDMTDERLVTITPTGGSKG
jgi:succinate-semialdehyde dehydrogenase/glutarate-semialdehyde dehydrogenase